MTQLRTSLGNAAAVPHRSTKLDGFGVLIFGAGVAVVYLSAAVEGGSPDAIAALLAACGITLVISRSVGLISKVVVPALLVVVAGVVAIDSSGDIFSRAPLSGPFRYANAKGAFFAQAAIAGAMVAAASRSMWGKVAGVTSAIVFAMIPFASGIEAAILVLAILVPMAALAIHPRITARSVVTAMGLLLGLTLLATLVLGLSYSSSDRTDAVDVVVDRSLSERRVALWHEALTMMTRDPLTGIGPNRFQFESATARDDPDARWTHNEFFQFGAETGVAGFAALVGVFVWGILRLRSHDGSPLVTAFGGAAIVALGIHSCVDYVLHFPAVPLVSAALVGTAMAPSRLRGSADRGAFRS